MEDLSDAAVIAASLDDPVRFGVIFDRHATVLHRYLVRRLGPDEADGMVGEIFRIAVMGEIPDDDVTILIGVLRAALAAGNDRRFGSGRPGQ